MTGAAATPVIAMPMQDGSAVLRPMTFANLQAKANWLDAAASLDATDPEVVAVARRFAIARGANHQCGIARDLHDFVRDGIPYVFGDGHQRFYSSRELLNGSGGNCADKARLFVALCRAVEIEARIVPIFTSPDEFVHVQAQVRCPGSTSDPRAEPGGWLRAELIARGVPLGSGAEAARYDRNGRVILS